MAAFHQATTKGACLALMGRQNHGRQGKSQLLPLYTLDQGLSRWTQGACHLPIVTATRSFDNYEFSPWSPGHCRAQWSRQINFCPTLQTASCVSLLSTSQQTPRPAVMVTVGFLSPELDPSAIPVERAGGRHSGVGRADDVWDGCLEHELASSGGFGGSLLETVACSFDCSMVEEAGSMMSRPVVAAHASCTKFTSAARALPGRECCEKVSMRSHKPCFDSVTEILKLTANVCVGKGQTEGQ